MGGKCSPKHPESICRWETAGSQVGERQASLQSAGSARQVVGKCGATRPRGPEHRQDIWKVQAKRPRSYSTLGNRGGRAEALVMLTREHQHCTWRQLETNRRHPHLSSKAENQAANRRHQRRARERETTRRQVQIAQSTHCTGDKCRLMRPRAPTAYFETVGVKRWATWRQVWEKSSQKQVGDKRGTNAESCGPKHPQTSAIQVQNDAAQSAHGVLRDSGGQVGDKGNKFRFRWPRPP